MDAVWSEEEEEEEQNHLGGVRARLQRPAFTDSTAEPSLASLNRVFHT